MSFSIQTTEKRSAGWSFLYLLMPIFLEFSCGLAFHFFASGLLTFPLSNDALTYLLNLRTCGGLFVSLLLMSHVPSQLALSKAMKIIN